MTDETPGGTRTVQATVRTYDLHQHTAQVLLDDGTPLDVPARALAGSGYLHLRVGQRVRLTVDRAGLVVHLTWPTGKP